MQAGATTSMGAAAITLITSVQFLSITSSVSANISESYRVGGAGDFFA